MPEKLIVTLGCLIVLCAGSLFADQTAIKSYSKARKVFWEQLYPGGGWTLYCGQRFHDKEGLNVEHVYPACWMAHDPSSAMAFLIYPTRSRHSHP